MLVSYILNLKKYGTSMATEYCVKIKVQLRPIGRPWVKLSIGNHQQTIQLETVTEFAFEFAATNSATLKIEHFDKSATDPDTAVEIVSVGFFDIEDPKFAWQGVYRPDYPEPWFSEQDTAPPAELPGQTYLGWNGTYSLTFAVPVFTWIHQVQNLGWIYN